MSSHPSAGEAVDTSSTMDDYQKQMEREWERHGRHEGRRLSIVAALRTKKYMTQLCELMEEIGCHTLAFTKSTPRAEKQKSEYPALKWEWVYQYENGGYSGDSYAGFVYVEIKPNRYLRMHYAM
jgi:hypothetical protein